MLIPVNLPVQALLVGVPHVQTAQRATFPGGLAVTFDQATKNESDGTVTMTGHVVAKYESPRTDGTVALTTIVCAKLTLWPSEKRGKAEGTTTLTDPEGTAVCHELSFDWAKKTGDATGVSLLVAGARLTAETLHVKPKKWTMEHATGTLSRYQRPSFRFWADTVEIIPGEQGTAHRVFLEVLGKKFGPVANVDFNLDSRVSGFNTPNISNKRGAGFGLAWDSSILLTEKSSIGATLNSFPRTSPEAVLQYSFSPLDPNSSPFSIAPRTELAEHLGDGWFDSINMKTPEEEDALLHEKRQSYGVSTRINQDTFARLPDARNVTQPIDFAAEWGGRANSLGYLFTTHVQRVREDRAEPWVDRMVLQGTVKAPTMQFGSFRLSTRFDIFTTSSSRGLFAFGRAETGLVYQPLAGVNMGVGLGIGSSLGSPDFAFDRMPYDKSLLARVDYRRGPYTARLIWKWDLETHVLYDREFEFALVADGFEPFVMSRKFPSDFRIGIRFRLDSLADRLSKRDVKPRQPAK